MAVIRFHRVQYPVSRALPVRMDRLEASKFHTIFGELPNIMQPVRLK